jgi:rare lipoprotein A
VIGPLALILSTMIPAAAQPAGAIRDATPAAAVVIVGNASYYEEFTVTSSGEPYDPKAFTAAVRSALRDKFGGVKSGPAYRPAYVIAEYRGKRAVLKINNVGTMKPERPFDLSRAAMEYFGGIKRGLINDLRVTILPLGRHYKLGPLTGEVEEIVVTAAPPAAVPPPLAVIEKILAPLLPAAPATGVTPPGPAGEGRAFTPPADAVPHQEKIER